MNKEWYNQTVNVMTPKVEPIVLECVGRLSGYDEQEVSDESLILSLPILLLSFPIVNARIKSNVHISRQYR